MSVFSHLDIGQIGETAALQHYEKEGYRLVEKNVRIRTDDNATWAGEIDIVVQKGKEFVIIEVKSVSCTSFARATEEENPALNVHEAKQKRLRRAIGAYIVRERISEWRLDIVTVFVNTRQRRARVSVMEDVILE